jgi:ribosomal protein S18 acetylase RimI-like enzyme
MPCKPSSSAITLTCLPVTSCWQTERGQGAGSWLMERLLEEAHLRNDVHMELEVISQNEHAIKLYEKYGFKKLRRLVGFVCADPQSSSTSVPEPCEIAAVAALVSAHSLPHLPWQVDGETLLRLGTAPRAFHLNGAYAVTGNPSAEHVAIRCLIVEPDVRRQGRALALLRALFAAYPGKTWHVPQIFPEEMAGVFEKAGFAAETLSQLQMKLQF